MESWTCFVFSISGTGIITLIFDCYYYFLGILVLSSITMISGPFLKREVFILCILTSTFLYQKYMKFDILLKLSEAAVIGILESKLDDSFLSSEIQIEDYDLICSDRNRHGGGVACFIRNNLSYNMKSFLPSEIENIFTEIFFTSFKASFCGYYLSSTKPR